MSIERKKEILTPTAPYPVQSEPLIQHEDSKYFDFLMKKYKTIYAT